MIIKSKTKAAVIIGIVIVIVSISAFFAYRYIPILFADKTWIKELGYKENEVHKLTFDWFGDRSCPEIPVKVGNKEYKFGFDTGCGKGILFTNAVENKIDYDLLGKTEELDRDGSHRGWSKSVKVSEIDVFGSSYNNIQTTISDWSMYSSKKFNGTIGLAYFKSKVITLDYAGHRIAISSKPIDYSKLNPDKYTILPLYKTTTKGQQDLPFFEAEYNNKQVAVYLDTGKNYSYLNNPDSNSLIGDKPNKFFDIPIKIGNMQMTLKEVTEAKNFAQVEGLPYPVMIELNSDEIWKCNLLVTFDLIEQKIIFSKS